LDGCGISPLNKLKLFGDGYEILNHPKKDLMPIGLLAGVVTDGTFIRVSKTLATVLQQ